MSDADSSGGVRDCEEVNNDFDQVLQLIPPPTLHNQPLQNDNARE